MSSKKKIMKILEDLSLPELHEARTCIDHLITKREEVATKPQKETNKTEEKLPGLLRKERSYDIFPCKVKKIHELRKPAFLGMVVDISQGGLRLKTKKKIAVGNILVIFPEKKEETGILTFSPDYDHIGNKIFVEVIRAKELMGIYEAGCKFLPRDSLLFNIIV
ncbi:MAG: PilZ domain-containing protein [Candidatus Brocadia sp. AMX2]|nr:MULTISPECIES: PilZ domain-containing protein [Brocadia]MBC6932429.1 PilZ domain-containing protein [Candidatus Brocadia sp.]MBL1170605.1 PilZ domain-containing protein [Candidatus Brocadia sp. AMX1]MCK6468558.1 PilZ domain-containing protein [Candidatus Brocadia sinica]NOG42115.1 PilZ domain-containing protein [Planctomycetota bacterium]KAA0244841.1 MAG: PilZ domain-containing protein [Candidatus Brocadia sp. AMX2]